MRKLCTKDKIANEILAREKEKTDAENVERMIIKPDGKLVSVCRQVVTSSVTLHADAENFSYGFTSPLIFDVNWGYVHLTLTHT